MEMELEIRDRILENIHPEKIIVLNMGPIYLIVVVWNKEKSSFEKRVHIRRLLKFVNVPFDITVLTSDKFGHIMQKIDSLTFEVIKNGDVMYNKRQEYLAI